jgi:hypothetical protein
VRNVFVRTNSVLSFVPDYVTLASMLACGSQASLIVTLTPAGTSTNVVRRRVELRCSLPTGHEGPHRDAQHAEEWDEVTGRLPTLLRHEDEDV